MSPWIDSLVGRFPTGVSRLWIAIDPDDVLLEEQLIAALNGAGFELLEFDDPIVFRAEYEERFRRPLEVEAAAGPSLILRYRRSDPNELPWDYVSHARVVRLGLSELFPNLAISVVRSLEPRYLAQLFEAHRQHVPQPLGETASKDFILAHIFKISPVLIGRPEDLWRELLRCHYTSTQPPPLLTQRITDTLTSLPQFRGIDLALLWSSKVAAVDALQEGWTHYLAALDIELPGDLAAPPATGAPLLPIPFAHPDVRTFVDSMFLDGDLHPVAVSRLPGDVPQWVRLGIKVPSESALKLVQDTLEKLEGEIPGEEANHRDWSTFANRFGELQKRYHLLDYALATSVRTRLDSLRRRIDASLLAWLRVHFGTLPSLPIGAGPAVISHIPRYLDIKRTSGEARVALVVFDGMSIDQWKQIKDHLAQVSPEFVTDDMAVFSWLPTLTSVCRQSIFSGLKPREYADSIETTAKEEALWARFWLDRGVRKSGVGYLKGLKRIEQLDALERLATDSNILAQGIVVDAIDELVHGAVFGKRGIAGQIRQWLETGFVEQLLTRLLRANFRVYITSDHGNTDAIGIGRPRQGEVSEQNGERTRLYRSELLRSQAQTDIHGTDSLTLGALPPDYLPIFPGSGRAFVDREKQIVAHGGPSLEELLVPFVEVSYK